MVQMKRRSDGRRITSYAFWFWLLWAYKFLCGVVFMVGHYLYHDSKVSAIGTCMLVLYLVLAPIFLRCPKCRARVKEKDYMRAKVCPHCGERL